MIGRLLHVNGAILGLLCAVSALALAEQEGGQKAPTPETLPKPGLVLPSGRPQAVAQARSGTRRLYMATETGLFATDNQGRRWDRLGVSPSGNADILALAVDPLNEERLYVGGRGGLWNSPDGGVSWKSLSNPAAARSAIRSIAVAPTVPETIYIGTEREGIFRSPDASDTWIPASRGLPEALAGGRPAPIRSLAVDPTNPSIAYAGTELHGLYKTTNGGASWAAINRGLGLFPLPRRVGSPGLLIDRTDPRQMMAMLVRPLHSRSVKTFVYQSSDGGEHWFALEVELPSGTQGIALAEDPSHPQMVVLLTTKGGIRIQWRPVAGVETTGEQP